MLAALASASRSPASRPAREPSRSARAVAEMVAGFGGGAGACMRWAPGRNQSGRRALSPESPRTWRGNRPGRPAPARLRSAASVAGRAPARSARCPGRPRPCPRHRACARDCGPHSSRGRAPGRRARARPRRTRPARAPRHRSKSSPARRTPRCRCGGCAASRSPCAPARPARALRRRVGQHEQEFLAAEAGDQVALALLECLRGGADHLVTEEVPVAVIDALEVVDVGDHDRGAPSAWVWP